MVQAVFVDGVRGWLRRHLEGEIQSDACATVVEPTRFSPQSKFVMSCFPSQELRTSSRCFNTIYECHSSFLIVVLQSTFAARFTEYIGSSRRSK